MKNKEHIQIETANEANQNEDVKEEDVFVREKIERAKKLGEELNNKVYSKDEIETIQKQKKKKPQKIGMKVMLINTIIASFAVVFIVFHLKGYI